MRIVTAPDRRVRDPETRRVIGPEGLTIDPTNLHWSRLLACGDVVEATELETPRAAPAALAAPSEEPEA